MTYKFTKKAEKTIQIAEKLAIELGHNYVGTEHILYGLVKETSGIANKVLENQNITAEAVLEKIEELVGVGETKNTETMGLTPRTKKVIENASVPETKPGDLISNLPSWDLTPPLVVERGGTSDIL